MEYFLYLCSTSPAQFFVHNTNIGQTQSTQDYISIKTDETNFFIMCYATTKPLLPQCANINILNNTILCTNSNIRIVKLYKNYYKIQFNLPLCITYKPSVLKKNILLNNCNLSFFDSTMQYVLISNNNGNYKITINYVIENAEFKIFNKYYALLGKVENKDYLLIFNNLGNVIFEDCTDVIELTQNTISTLNKMQDIAMHGFVSVYKFEENSITLKEQYTVFLKEKPIYTKNKFCISIAFLEAININNIKLARYYLNDELNASLTDQQLTNFFGDYLEFEPNFLTNANNSIFFVYSNNVTKLYNFIIKQDKIIDITTD